MKSFHTVYIDSQKFGIYNCGMTKEKKERPSTIELFMYFCYWSMIPEDDRVKDEKNLIRFGQKYKRDIDDLYEWLQREDYKTITEQTEKRLAPYYLSRIKGNIVKNSRRDSGSQKLGLMFFGNWVPKESREIDGALALMTVERYNQLKELAGKELAGEVKKNPEVVQGAGNNVFKGGQERLPEHEKTEGGTVAPVSPAVGGDTQTK